MRPGAVPNKLAAKLADVISLHISGPNLRGFSMPIPLTVIVLKIGDKHDATIALQLSAGIAIALGWRARLGAAALGLFSLATAILFHNNFANRIELLHFDKDLAIAGGMFVLMVRGAGAWSVDGLSYARKLAAVTA
jgi:uncharacterized membrane protein YphA (DoxX/SURF4 family)